MINQYPVLTIALAPILVILLQKLLSTRSSKNKIKTFFVTKNDNHMRRRIQHVLTGLLFYVLSFIIPPKLSLILLIISTIIFYIILKIRIKYKRVNEWYMNNFGPLLRSHECKPDTLPGAFWFMLGTTISFGCFEQEIARISLLCLSLGDPLAAIIGIRFSTSNISSDDTKILGSKSVSGCCACFIVSFFIGLLCSFSRNDESRPNTDGDDRLWHKCKFAVISGITATFMETFSSVLGLDDNLGIPLGTGCMLTFFR